MNNAGDARLNEVWVEAMYDYQDDTLTRRQVAEMLALAITPRQAPEAAGKNLCDSCGSTSTCNYYNNGGRTRCSGYTDPPTQEAQATRGWISVKDRLPDRQKDVRYSEVLCLVVHKGDVKILSFNHEHMCWDDESKDDFYCAIGDVTCWMPLPDRPKAEPQQGEG